MVVPFEAECVENRQKIGTIWVNEIREAPFATVLFEFSDNGKTGWSLAGRDAIDTDYVARSLVRDFPNRVVGVWILAVQERVEVESDDFALGS